MFVYRIVNRVNGKCYIGKANDPEARWLNHKWQACNGSRYAIHCAIRKYGEEAFEFSILEAFSSEQNAYTAESEYIDLYNSTVDGHGYNMTKGGEGVIFTPELQKKHRAICNTPEYKQKLSQIHKNLWSDLEFRESKLKVLIAGRRTPEARQRQSEIAKEFWDSEGVMDNASAALKAVISDPDKLAARNKAISDAYKTEEGRANKSAAMSKLWEDPEYRAAQCNRLKQVRNTPEAKRKQAEINHARANTPEKLALKAKIIELREASISVRDIVSITGANRGYVYSILRSHNEKNKTHSG